MSKYCFTENTVLNNSDEKDSLKTKLNKTDQIKNILQKALRIFSNFKNKLPIFSIKENSFFRFLKNKFFYIHFISASIVTFFLFWSLLPLIDSYTSNGEELKLKDFQGLFIEEVSIDLEQLGLKYQISDYVFTDSVPKGTIFTQTPSPGTFVKEGRLIYFTVNRNSSEKFVIPEGIFDGKNKNYTQRNLGSHFNLYFSPENGSDQLVVRYLSSAGKNLIVGDSLIKGSIINVYLELDEDKANRNIIDKSQSTDSTIIE